MSDRAELEELRRLEELEARATGTPPASASTSYDPRTIPNYEPPEREGPGLLRSFGRGLAIGTGSTTNMLSDAPSRMRNSAARMMGGQGTSELQSARYNRFLEQAGMPPPQTTGEYLAAGAGEAVGGFLDPINLMTMGLAKGAPAAANLVRRATAKEAIDANYKLPPSQVPGIRLGDAVEGLSGRSNIIQDMRYTNQGATDALARKALRLPPDAPLTAQAVDSYIATTAQQGYGPLEALGNINMRGLPFKREINALVTKYAAPSVDFPAVKVDELKKILESYKVDQFSGMSGSRIMQFIRQRAGSSDPAESRAYKDLAKVFETNIRRDLSRRGLSDAVSSLDETRVALAKAYVVKKALREGTGSVDPRTVGNMLNAGAPLTEELNLIGRASNAFPQVISYPTAGEASPFGLSDIAVGMGGAVAGIDNPKILAAIASRYLGREALKSAPYQKLQARALGKTGPGLRLGQRTMLSIPGGLYVNTPDFEDENNPAPNLFQPE